MAARSETSPLSRAVSKRARTRLPQGHSCTSGWAPSSVGMANMWLGSCLWCVVAKQVNLAGVMGLNRGSWTLGGPRLQAEIRVPMIHHACDSWAPGKLLVYLVAMLRFWGRGDWRRGLGTDGRMFPALLCEGAPRPTAWVMLPSPSHSQRAGFVTFLPEGRAGLFPSFNREESLSME